MKNGNWVHMKLTYTSCLGGRDLFIPDVDHIHWKGEVIYGCDVHVIVFDIPIYGLHHFISHSYSSNNERDCLKKPRWLNDLYSSFPSLDLDAVILAINSSAFTSARLCPKSPMKPNVFYASPCLRIACTGNDPGDIVHFAVHCSSISS
ncbi:hypothetical protein MLD38_028812 [Melastoma candidum]|uniref:Uncharacterized protein n=1 Tax=Melastoma candidum TaxID=119954 RepID=A0ACB9N7V7_9MYRT|nr:hypothetical protein MLD38_028812 [Melastoma candidum]